MQPFQIKAPLCRSSIIGSRLEQEILALRGIAARLEETVADLTRPAPLSLGLKERTPRHGLRRPNAGATTSGER